MREREIDSVDLMIAETGTQCVAGQAADRNGKRHGHMAGSKLHNHLMFFNACRTKRCAAMAAETELVHLYPTRGACLCHEIHRRGNEAL